MGREGKLKRVVGREEGTREVKEWVEKTTRRQFKLRNEEEGKGKEYTETKIERREKKEEEEDNAGKGEERGKNRGGDG